MRVWTLHPKHLDPKGLVALWREALLAQKVLHGATRGYRHHPQLARFRARRDPVAAIAEYLRAVAAEAQRRGYSFDETKILPDKTRTSIPATQGQLDYEWQHLLNKLRLRHPEKHREILKIGKPEPHPLFRIVPGGIEPWEITEPRRAKRNS